MRNFVLRYFLAVHGLNADNDVQLRVIPMAEMVANLRGGNIDVILGPDPFNQRAVYHEVGYQHTRQGLVERSSLLRFWYKHRVHLEEPQHLRRAISRRAHFGRHGARFWQP
jgi:NMT1-like family